MFLRPRSGSPAFSFSGPIAAFGLAAASVLVAADPAAAQAVRDVEPHHVVVTTDNLPMKAGAGTVHYPVALLREGRVLRVDGETIDGGQFFRVEYLPEMVAYVKADEVAEDGKNIRLLTPSRLRAANPGGGERGHWWHLLPEGSELPAGTVLKITEVLKTDDRTHGYYVAAPRQSRGYVPRASVRTATEAEIAKYREMWAAASGEAPRPAVTQQQPTPGAQPTAAQPAPAQPQNQPGDVVPVSERPPAPDAGQPTPPSPAPSVPADPAPAQPEQPRTEAPTPAQRQIATLESLASLYDQAQAQPIKDAELGEVMAEFQRTIDALSANPDDRRTADFLRARLAVLKLRQELQQSLREAEQLAGSTSTRGKDYSEAVTALDRARSYTVVGRLVPSNVYDGTRLPKMYRVQSVDEGFSRTLAYVIPGAGEDADLQAKLGRVVGILGDAQLDPALRINLVRPRRVDILSPSTPAAPAAQPTPAGN